MIEEFMPFRSVPAATAVDLALREADRLLMALRSEQIGTPGSPTIVSRLVRDGHELAVGSGKGPGEQGVASAHFEALERYHMSAPDNRRLAPGAARLLPAARIAGQDGLGPDLAVQRWAAEFPDNPAACAAYHGRRSKVWYPLFLSDPRYFRHPMPGDSVEPYRSLLRYSSSLGTAAGVTLAEAVFHGLCELIEHDGVSHALLRWFIAGELNLDLVPPELLPDRLRTLHRDATNAARAPVHLIDVTTDLGVPVYLAIANDDGALPALVGAGASPLPWYAAQRALNELVQSCALNGARSAHQTGSAAQRLATWPALQQCAQLPVRRLMSGHVRTVALRDISSTDLDPEHGLDHLTSILRRHAVEYFVCELTPPRSHIAVAATMAPGLERFSLVRFGVPILPTGRGSHLWDAGLAAARATRSTTDRTASASSAAPSPSRRTAM